MIEMRFSWFRNRCGEAINGFCLLVMLKQVRVSKWGCSQTYEAKTLGGPELGAEPQKFRVFPTASALSKLGVKPRGPPIARTL